MINYRFGHRLPLGPVVLAAYEATQPLLGLLPLAILLFPDGQLPSCRCRRLIGGYYAIVTGLLLGLYSGLVLLATRVLTVNSPVAVAAATARPRRRSARCADGCSSRWTGGSTGPGTWINKRR